MIGIVRAIQKSLDARRCFARNHCTNQTCSGINLYKRITDFRQKCRQDNVKFTVMQIPICITKGKRICHCLSSYHLAACGNNLQMPSTKIV